MLKLTHILKRKGKKHCCWKPLPDVLGHRAMNHNDRKMLAMNMTEPSIYVVVEDPKYAVKITNEK